MKWKLRGAASALLIGLVGCGGNPSTPTTPSNPTPTPAPSSNRPPVIESLIISPEFGIADLEVFTFDVKASDPDGDQLRYAWRLFIGPSGEATGSGPRLTAQYTGGVSATYSTTVTVTDARGASVEGTVSVTVGSVNGTWKVTSGAFAGATFGLLQSESGAITGSYFLPGAGSVERLEGSQVGQINTAAAVMLPLRNGSRTMTFTGTMDRTGRTIRGAIDGVPCDLIVQ